MRRIRSPELDFSLMKRRQKFKSDEILLGRRPWYLLAIVLFIISAIARQPIVFLFALCTLVIGLIPEIWYRLALRSLLLSQHVSHARAFYGDNVTLSISVENQKFLPLPWLEINDEVSSDLLVLNGKIEPTYKPKRSTLVNAFSLWSFQRVTRRYTLRPKARGVYTFGPALVRTCDPFGWLVREEQISAPTSLLVYPPIIPLENFGLAPHQPFGDHTMPRHLFEDPLRMVGIRDYLVGDDPRRIHWKATARAGELRSKIYEPNSQHHVLFFLEINTYKESWMGIDPDIQELTISASASLTQWALDEGYTVSLVANSLLTNLLGTGMERTPPPINPAPSSQLVAASTQSFINQVKIPFARDDDQWERILSALARLVPYFGSPMHKLIDNEHNNLPFGTVVVLVSPGAVLAAETVESLLALRVRGASVHLALTGEGDEKVTTYDLPVHYLGGKETWHEFIASTNRSSAAAQQ